MTGPVTLDAAAVEALQPRLARAVYKGIKDYEPVDGFGDSKRFDHYARIFAKSASHAAEEVVKDWLRDYAEMDAAAIVAALTEAADQ